MKHRMLILLMVFSLFFTACSSANNTPVTSTAIPTVIADSTIIAEGRVEPIRFADIAFNAGGMVSAVLVKEGQSVKKGETLVRLGDESDTNYAGALLELANAQQAMNDLQNQAGSALAQAVIDLRDAQEAYDKADNYLKDLTVNPKVPQTKYSAKLVATRNGWRYDYKTNNFKGPAPEDWIIEAQNDQALKKALLDEAQRTFERKQNGADKDQLTLLEARLNAAKAKVAAFSVIAPFDGVVAKLNAKEGSSINAGEIAVTITDASSWIIKTTDVTEIDVVKLTEGEPVTITLDAIPGVTLKGKVLSIGQSFAQSQGDIVYEVTVLLTDMNPEMRWGMTAAVKFE